MISNAMSQLKQDLTEVEGKIEDLEQYAASYSEFKELKEWFFILQEHLKDHIDDVENFVGRIN
ncbi:MULTISPECIES: hypothetical protein [Bacteria]|uniref:hypothetical protein n=1 Tax=Bacteria TaxID=2 RepID=UPI0012B16191|nr:MULTISPECIES: hypothetical protein [Bacteria]MRY42829.1 hypothetical protein [Parabacteroides distasonis]MZK53321.1 hypothetical protein [Clostridium beijerinckii]MZK61426.1 hypothetical protein [Clostridium beijerinckii]MZK71668.1 hypothetical protein [Clostridium beijerinckii]MZK77061.1 hypothetical protein [Clostridium beijerinckii]